MQLFKETKLFFYFLLLANALFAQKYPSKNFSTLEGLSSNSIQSVFKDSRGILWVGTDNGLAKIVNNEIENFYEKDGLAYNNCWDIKEDQNQNLWFGSYGGGLTFYNGKNFKIFNTKNGLIHDLVRKLFIYKNYIYVATHNGISVININTHSINNYNVTKKNKLNFQAMDFFNIDNSIYCVTYKDGCWKINENNLTQTKSKTDDIFSAYPYENSIALGVLDQKTNKYTLKIFDKNNFINGKFPDKTLGNNIFWRFNKASDHFFVTGNGITLDNGGLFDIKNDSIVNVSKLYGIESTSPWSVFYDKNIGKLFTGSKDKGLYVTDLHNKIVFIENNNSNQINAIESINNCLVFLDFKNLEIRKNNKIIKKISLIDFYKKANFFIKNNPKKYSNIFSGFQYKLNDNTNRLLKLKIINNHLWVNSTFGFFTFDSNFNFEAYHNYESVDFINDFDNQIIFQKAFVECIKTKDILKNNSIITFPLKNSNSPRDVNCLIKGKDNIYFFSSSNGLYEYKNGLFKSFLQLKIWNEKNLTIAKKISEYKIAVANAQGDIFIIDNTQKFKLIKKIDRELLFGRTINFIEIYKKNLLIGTEKGINIYNGKSIRLLDDELGFKNNIFSSGLVVKDNLIIGTTNGYYQFNLKNYFLQKQVPVKLNISKIEINYNPISNSYFKFFEFIPKKIDLPYNKNTLSITFSAKNHPFPNKLIYKYKVVGLTNSNWSNFSTSKTIILPFLPIGNFDIYVEVKDLYLGSISLHKILNVNINPPIWQTWWFIITVIIFLSILAHLIYKKRIAFIKKQEQIKSEVQKRFVETKMEALQSQMNPHFIFNAMNSIQYYIINNNTDDALMYMSEFSKLIRKTLNNSSKTKITLFEEIEYIKSYVKLENMRFNNAINFKLIKNNLLDLTNTIIPPMIIQPFLENAFVHAFDSNSINPCLTLTLTNENDDLLIKITDNGYGMETEKLNKLTQSKGIKLTKERINLFQTNKEESVKIHSEKKGGTTVTLKILKSK